MASYTFFIYIYLTASCSAAAVKIILQIPREGCWGAEPCLEDPFPFLFPVPIPFPFLPFPFPPSLSSLPAPMESQRCCLEHTPARVFPSSPLREGIPALPGQCWSSALLSAQGKISPVGRHSIKPFALTPGVLVKVVQIMEAKSSLGALSAVIMVIP